MCGMTRPCRGFRPIVLPLLLLVLLPGGCDTPDDLVKPKAGGANAPAAAAEDVVAMAESLPADLGVNEWLLDVCKQHGFPARLDGEWVAFEGSPVRLGA